MKHLINFLFLLAFLSHTIFDSCLFAQENDHFEMIPVSEEAFFTMTQFYQYDKGIPLEAHVVEKLETNLYIREKIVFTGSHASRVPCYLTIPKTASPPYPCILQLHGQDAGGKSSWWPNDSANQITEALLDKGFALLALDARYEGERKGNNDYESSIIFMRQQWFHKFREMLVESVVDYRRGIDYLSTRTEIDTSKIGVFGYSIGGMMTFFLTGVDSRIKVSVAAVTPLMGKNSPADNPNFSNYQLSAISPRNYTKAINNRPFLMLMGTKDYFYTVDEAQQVYNLINSNAKNIIFYNCSHQLPVEHIETTAKWFQDNL